MAVGYACICIGDYNRMRSVRLKDVSEKKLDEIYAHNLDVLISNILYNTKHGIKLFRISSDIFPLITHDDIDYDWRIKFKNRLDDIKSLIKDTGLKVSMHPGQYTVINSINDGVAMKAVAETDHHSDFLSHITDDDHAPVILHAASAGRDRRLAAARFVKYFEMLSSDSKKRLCIENDERSSTAKDVYELASMIGIPCIFDDLHNKINPSYDLSDKEIIRMFSETFQGRRQKIHYSQQSGVKRNGAHSVTIDHKRFLEYYNDINGKDLDIMLEVKDKDLSCIKCQNVLKRQTSGIFAEWARYKYFVMERDIGIYNSVSEMFAKKSFSYTALYDFIEEAVAREPSSGSETNALTHVWGYFKKIADAGEKKKYMDHMNKNKGTARTKDYLLSLAIKYDIGYLKESIYFFSEIYNNR